MLALLNGTVDDSERNYVELCSDVSILYVRVIQFRNGVRSTNALSIATRAKHSFKYVEPQRTIFPL